MSETVRSVNVDDLDEFFPTAEQVITPAQEPAKNVLTPEDKNQDIHDPADQKTTPPPAEAPKVEEPAERTQEEIEEALSFEEVIEKTEEENKNQGRSKTDKSGIVELYKKRITAGQMVTFDDFTAEPTDADYEEKLDEYLRKLSMKDYEELWDSNLKYQTERLEEEVPQQFFESLPEELQFAAKYVADGGTDLKGLFRALAQVEEMRELDPVKDAKEVAYQYLRATNFGTEEEIQEQLEEWEDLKSLEKKATAFKPKLDKMQEQVVQNQLAQEEKRKAEREELAQRYVQNVTEALKTPEIGGIKLDKKTHDFLVNGMLQPAYPSRSGKPTNLLGHLLEKYQMDEPNYPLVAEALFLLSRPEEYRESLRAQGGNKKVEETARKLKTEQANRQGSSTYQNDESDSRSKSYKVPRPGNILTRR